MIIKVAMRDGKPVALFESEKLLIHFLNGHCARDVYDLTLNETNNKRYFTYYHVCWRKFMIVEIRRHVEIGRWREVIVNTNINVDSGDISIDVQADDIESALMIANKYAPLRNTA